MAPVHAAATHASPVALSVHGILDVIHGLLVLVPIRSRAGTARSKGLLDSGTKIQMDLWTTHLHNIL
jgi:hypothetical protein